jgi:hypothetical protein
MSITARSLLNQLSEIPHLMIAVGMGKELFVHCDLVRVEMLLPTQIISISIIHKFFFIEVSRPVY